jgi:hypothetical protein
MTNMPISPLESQMGAWTRKLGSAPVTSTKRGHGGLAWSLPLAEKIMRQPQDGAPDARRRLAMMASPISSNTLDEPDDARLTGGTRSLARRLLGLNVLAPYKKVAKKVVATIRRPQVA